MGRTPGALNKKTLEKMKSQQSIHIPLSAPAPAVVPDIPVPALDPLPRPVAQFVEYTAPDGKRWRVERGRQLLADFEMIEEQMPLWHECLLCEERIVNLVRRFYAVAPMVGGETEFLNPQSLADIAAKLSLTEELVQSEIDAGKTLWKKWLMMKNSTNSAKAYTEDMPQLEAAMSKELVERLLRLHGFEDLMEVGVSEGDRLFAAERIRHLQHQLEDAEGCTIARSAIRMELQMNMYDRIISRLTRESEDTSRKKEDRTTSFSELDRIIKARQTVAKSHSETMEDLNLTQAQNQSVKAKTNIQDCLGTMLKAVAEYESRGDTTLIDGIFTAYEIKILTTPLNIRPQQYRPDIVILANHCLERHNLFDPDYVPPSFPRKEFRRFMTAFQKAIHAAAEESGDVIEVEESDNDTGSDSEDTKVEDTPVHVPQEAVPMAPGEMAQSIRKKGAGDDIN